MLNPRLASRYAKSLIDLSTERGELERVYKDMLYLQELTQVSKEFVALLRSPVISPDKKDKIMDAVTGGKISPLTTSFNKLMVSKGRESVLPEVANAFVEQYKKVKNIHTVKLTTAIPMSDQLKKAILAQIRKTGNMDQIDLVATVNPDIIGGFVLQTGDQLVDASISYDLKEIAKQFTNNDFIYKVR